VLPGGPCGRFTVCSLRSELKRAGGRALSHSSRPPLRSKVCEASDGKSLFTASFSTVYRILKERNLMSPRGVGGQAGHPVSPHHDQS
jgi:hypothetical protein